MNTQFSYDNDAIHLNQLTALAQGQKVELKGYLYNYLMYLAGTRKDLEGELDLQSDRIDLEKLLIMPSTSSAAGKDFVSDEILWSGSFNAQSMDIKTAYNKIVSDQKIVRDFFLKINRFTCHKHK